MVLHKYPSSGPKNHPSCYDYWELMLHTCAPHWVLPPATGNCPSQDSAPSRSVDHSNWLMWRESLAPLPPCEMTLKSHPVACSWAGRVKEAVGCCGGHLKQQAKNEKAKRLVPCCSSISKRLRPEKALTRPGLFSHGRASWLRVRWISADVGITSPTVEGALNKRLWQLYGLWSLSGKAGSGKVLGTGWEWGKHIDFPPVGVLRRGTKRPLVESFRRRPGNEDQMNTWARHLLSNSVSGNWWIYYFWSQVIDLRLIGNVNTNAL